jgi:hypothetical protein
MHGAVLSIEDMHDLDTADVAQLRLGNRVSAFKLRGTVRDGAADNDVLDVWRLEQRLRYLAFPAMGYGLSSGSDVATPNTLQEFVTDGQWGMAESHAANAHQLTISATSADPLFSYLNAYNAPHWMNIGAQMGSGVLGGWNNTQNGVGSAAESYGTSWMRDLFAARAYAPAALDGGRAFTFRGAVDANMGYTPSGHVTHDLGMAFDLGISRYIGGAQQANDAAVSGLNILDNSNAWSITNAITWSGLLPNTAGNNQRNALRDFLSLDAVTQDDGDTTNGTGWDNLPLQNAAARAALFGNGTLVDCWHKFSPGWALPPET